MKSIEIAAIERMVALGYPKDYVMSLDETRLQPPEAQGSVTAEEFDRFILGSAGAPAAAVWRYTLLLLRKAPAALLWSPVPEDGKQAAPQLAATEEELADVWLIKCTVILLGELAAGEKARIDISRNTTGLGLPPNFGSHGTVEIFKDDKSMGNIVGNGKTTVRGPGKITAHLQKDVDWCRA